jgi:hypothetical protein
MVRSWEIRVRTAGSRCVHRGGRLLVGDRDRDGAASAGERGGARWDDMGDLLSCPQHGLHLLDKREQRPNRDQREGESVPSVRVKGTGIGGGAANGAMVAVGQEEHKVTVTADGEHPINQ